jgi:hypothetical protein
MTWYGKSRELVSDSRWCLIRQMIGNCGSSMWWPVASTCKRSYLMIDVRLSDGKVNNFIERESTIIF